MGSLTALSFFSRSPALGVEELSSVEIWVIDLVLEVVTLGLTGSSTTE